MQWRWTQNSPSAPGPAVRESHFVDQFHCLRIPCILCVEYSNVRPQKSHSESCSWSGSGSCMGNPSVPRTSFGTLNQFHSSRARSSHMVPSIASSIPLSKSQRLCQFISQGYFYSKKSCVPFSSPGHAVQGIEGCLGALADHVGRRIEVGPVGGDGEQLSFCFNIRFKSLTPL